MITMKVELIKRTISGYLAILYSVISPILILFLPYKEEVSIEHAIASDGILWTAYFISGLGVLLNRTWGRKSVMIVFGVSALSKAYLLANFSDLENGTPALLINISLAVALLILISAFSMKFSRTGDHTITAQIAIKSKTADQKKIDTAYMCFLLLSYAIILGFIIETWFGMQTGDTSGVGGILGFFVFFPLFTLLLGTSARAVFLSFRFRWHRPLPIMSGLFFALLIFLPWDGSEFLHRTISIIYLILSVSFGIYWFAFTRKKVL